jgi:hypothetical protein
MRHTPPGLIGVDLTAAPGAVQGGFEDDRRSIGAGAASPDSLRIVFVEGSGIRFFWR